MKRLVFILPGTDTGGMERFLLRLLPRLREVAEVSVIVRSAHQGALHAHFVASGCDVHYQPVGYLDPLGKYKLYRLFRRIRPDTVCDLSGIFSGIPLMVARLASVGHRVTFHRRSTFAFRLTFGRKLYARLSIRLVEAMATGILANSRTALEFFHPGLVQKIDPRLAVIRNMMDPADLAPTRSRRETRAKLGVPEEARVVLHVGRLDPAKDHDTLLKVMVRIMTDMPDVHCLLAGPRTESLSEHFALVNSPAVGRFRLLGDRDDVPDLMAAADLFFFPSLTEGMPNALIEAIIIGLPVVASDISPIKEIIPEHGHRLLVGAGRVMEFTQAVKSCLNSREEQERRKYRAELGRVTAPNHVLPQLMEQLHIQESGSLP